MTPAVADIDLLLAVGGVVALCWIWSTAPMNRDQRFANAILVGGVVAIAFIVRFLI